MDKKLQIFIASPGDVGEERDIVSNIVVPELRRVFSHANGLTKNKLDFEAVRWETHSWPDTGEDAQDVINQQIGDFDILIGVMWKRYGSKTKRAESGTGEEFQRAYELFKKYKRPRIMFYFRKEPFYTTNSKDIAQFKKVLDFRNKLVKLGVFFWEYETPIEFERHVREHLIRQISQITEADGITGYTDTPPSTRPPAKSKNPSGKKKISKTTTKNRGRIFLSYSHADQLKVREIYYLLKNNGFSVWMDVESLLPGQDWNKEIEKEISSSKIILLFLSENSVSKEGYIQKEIKLALDFMLEKPEGSIYIIPIRLEPVQVPSRLAQIQWLDYFTEDGLDKLLYTLNNTIK